MLRSDREVLPDVTSMIGWLIHPTMNVGHLELQLCRNGIMRNLSERELLLKRIPGG